MRRPRFFRLWSSLAMALALAADALPASAISDFQARMAQTVWSAQQTEAILRTLPQSTRSVSTPEGLASYFALLNENVAALTGSATARGATDEQRKSVADGLGMLATALHDQAALAGNRGLFGAVATLNELEETCRAAVSQLAAVRPAAKP
ncbi:MAG: hypothetical protein ABI592_09345 [Acidobacteriota bacterium]